MNTAIKLREAQKNYEDRKANYEAALVAERTAWDALVKARLAWMNEKAIGKLKDESF